MLKKLINKLKTKKFNVCVIGLGYVGLPLVSSFIEAGIEVLGIDIDKKKINLLKNGKSYLQSTNKKTREYFFKNKKNLSTNFSIIERCDVIIVCLPTPLKNNTKEPDMSYIFGCAKSLKKYIKKNQIIILESTVYPGATREFTKKLINKDLKIGANLFVGYSPERENPGDKKFNYKTTPKVISGYTSNCLLLLKIIYKYFVKKTVAVKRLEEAELSKLLENLYRAVNIGLVNEMKVICKKLNISIFDTIDAASTKNFGFQKFLPGPGLGGHCIPIDPFYLSWISRKMGYDPKFIKLAGNINSNIPNWTINEMLKILKKKDKRILLLGVSYKKDIDDDRETPTYEFMKILKKKKIRFDYHDPYFPQIRKGRNINLNKKSIKLNKYNLKKFDAVILLTDHSFFNYQLIAKHAKLIIDTRGKYKNKFFENYKNIIFS